MKAITIAITNLKVIFRDFKSNAIVFVLPIVFMGIFAIAFGGESINTLNIGVVESNEPASEIFFGVLESVEKPGESEENFFSIKEFETEEDAELAVIDDNILLYLKYTSDGEEVFGDQTSSSFTIASSVVESITSEFFQIDNKFEANAIEGRDVSEESVFFFLVPGLIVYGILILIPQAAIYTAQIKEKNLIFRYFISNTKSSDIILGIALSQTFIAIIQTFILIFTAMIFGFEPKRSIPLALLITIPTNIFVVGFGLILGSLAEKGDTASNLGSVSSIILGFLSGSFIQGIDSALEFNFGDSTLSVVDFIPTSHATTALHRILVDNRGLDSVVTELLIVLGSGIVTLVIGIVLYQRKQLKYID